MVNLLIHGINGKMGRAVYDMASTSSDFNIVGGIDKAPCDSLKCKVYTSYAECDVDNAVVIDFSHHSAIPELVKFCTDRKLPLIVATTALEQEELALLKEASSEIPVLHSFNMSLGVNLIKKMMELMVPVLENDFNIEIIEKHHNMKKDSPSGTALLLADAINDSCAVKKNYMYGRHGKADECKITDLGIHSIRGGTNPGEHTIIFAGSDEIIEVTHSALSRKIFAKGALSAAKFLNGKPIGLYTMNDLM